MTRVTVETGNGDNGGAAAGAALVVGCMMLFWVLAAPVIFVMHLVALGANIFFDLGQVIAFSVLGIVGFLAIFVLMFRKAGDDLWTTVGRGAIRWGILSVGLLATYLLLNFGFKLQVFDNLFYWLEFPFAARRIWGG